MRGLDAKIQNHSKKTHKTFFFLRLKHSISTYAMYHGRFGSQPIGTRRSAPVLVVQDDFWEIIGANVRRERPRVGHVILRICSCKAQDL